MKKLNKKFTKYGEQFEQVCRTATTAIYLRHVNGRQKSYEVIVIRVAKRKPEKSTGKFRFVECEPYECYPSSEKWGEQAWTYIGEADARAKYDCLNDSFQCLSAIAWRPIRLRAADGTAQDCVLAPGSMETAESQSQLAGCNAD